MDRGRVIFDGNTEQAIDVYRDSLIRRNASVSDSLRAGTGEIRIRHVEVLNRLGQPQSQWDTGEFVTLRLHYTASEPVEEPVFNLVLHVMNGHQVTGIRTDLDGVRLSTLEGQGHVDVEIPNLNLLPNIYTVDAVIFHRDGVTFYDRLNQVATVKVRGGHAINGTTFLPHAWRRGAPHGAEIAAGRLK
jgi:hypothetical protein